MRDPKLLILDEATTGLDEIIEKFVKFKKIIKKYYHTCSNTSKSIL